MFQNETFYNNIVIQNYKSVIIYRFVILHSPYTVRIIGSDKLQLSAVCFRMKHYFIQKILKCLLPQCYNNNNKIRKGVSDSAYFFWGSAAQNQD